MQDEFNDPSFIGSPKYEYHQGWKLGQTDAKREFKKRFSENHSHFAAGYSEGYDRFLKDNPPNTGVPTGV